MIKSHILTASSHWQPGEPQNKEAILEELHGQIECACLGVAKDVQERQTKSGVKDAYTQFWIDNLLQQARALKKDNPGHTIGDIQHELLAWANTNANHIYSPFLTLHGASDNPGSDCTTSPLTHVAWGAILGQVST